MAPEHLERIWEPFFSTEQDEGTGLGLDMCRRTVLAHRGEISCENGPGCGATFTIRLPIAEVTQEAWFPVRCT
ncbi:MAG: hypothetical protein IH986_00690 [Planctomycetes bacterium]|nr:hypothetical protein [Planctomycetota bacterium]